MQHAQVKYQTYLIYHINISYRYHCNIIPMKIVRYSVLKLIHDQDDVTGAIMYKSNLAE